MNRKLSLTLKAIISTSLIIILLSLVGLDSIIKTLSKTNPWFLIAVILLYPPAIFLSSLNIFLLIKPIKQKIRFSKIVKFTFLAWSFGVLTPAKLGHFSMIYFLKKEGVNIGEGTAICILDKIISLSLNVLFFVLGFLLFFSLKQATAAIALVVLAAAIAFFFLLSSTGRNLIKRYLLRSYSVKFEGFSRYISNYIKKYKRYILINYIITFIVLVISSITLLLMFMSYGEFTSLFNVIIVRSINTLVSLIPITLDGLGIKESIGTFLFVRLGLTAPVIITSYLLLRVISYVISSILISFLFEKKVSKTKTVEKTKE